MQARAILRLVTAPFALLASGAAAPETPADDAMAVERTVMLMRHGVRAPLSDPAMPAGVAAAPWPAWPVPRAHLTPHGFDAVLRVGAYDRTVLPTGHGTGCPARGSVAVLADNDQRTIETGRAWVQGYATGCSIEPVSLPAGQADPIFAPIEAAPTAFDAKAARAAVERRLPPGGFAALDARHAALLDRLDAVLCGDKARSKCGVRRHPTGLRPDRAGREPRLSGAIEEGAKAIQILTLEYAQGMARPGWGRANPDDLRRIGALRAQLYDTIHRTPAVGRAFGGPTLRRMVGGLSEKKGAPRLTMLIGHDSNIAAVAGLLDLHWQAPGLAPDDPPLSGAIGLQLIGNEAGERFVRAFLRAPALDAIRADPEGADRPVFTPLPITACAPTPLACPIDRFHRIVNSAIAP